MAAESHELRSVRGRFFGDQGWFTRSEATQTTHGKAVDE
jgi:hypothetical protein